MREEQKRSQERYERALALKKSKDAKPLDAGDDREYNRLINELPKNIPEILFLVGANKVEFNTILADCKENASVDGYLNFNLDASTEKKNVAEMVKKQSDLVLKGTTDPDTGAQSLGGRVRAFRVLAGAHAVNGTDKLFAAKFKEAPQVCYLYKALSETKGVDAVNTLQKMYQSLGGLSVLELFHKIKGTGALFATLKAEIKADAADGGLYSHYITQTLFPQLTEGRLSKDEEVFRGLPAATQIRLFEALPPSPANEAAVQQFRDNLYQAYYDKRDAAQIDAAGEYQAARAQAEAALISANKAISTIKQMRAKLDVIDSDVPKYIAKHGKTDGFINRQRLLSVKKGLELQQAQKPFLAAQIKEAKLLLRQAYAELSFTQRTLHKSEDDAVKADCAQQIVLIRQVLKSAEKNGLEEERRKEDRHLAEQRLLAAAANAEPFSLFNGRSEGSIEAFEQHAAQGQGEAYVKAQKEALHADAISHVDFGVVAKSSGHFYAIELSDRWVRIIPFGTGHAMVSADNRHGAKVMLHNIPNDTQSQIKLAFKMVRNFQMLRENTYYEQEKSKARAALPEGAAFELDQFEAKIARDPVFKSLKHKPIYLKLNVTGQLASEQLRILLAVCQKLGVECCQDNVTYSKKASSWFDRHNFGVGYNKSPTASDFDAVDKYIKREEIVSKKDGRIVTASSIEKTCDEEAQKQEMVNRVRM